MKTQKLLLLPLLFIVLLITACYKDKPVPDPAIPTETGANALVCKVNGSLHIYKGKMFDEPGFSGPILSDGKGVDLDTVISGILSISAKDRQYDDHVELNVFSTQGNVLSTPVLNKPYYLTKHYSGSQYYISNGSGELTYKADTTRSFIIFTRYDHDVVAGKFEFYGINTAGKEIALTDGYFDIGK